ncbi:3-hydroxyisobutyryl-coenzyme A hydrolase isoform 1 [Mycena rebaudengoi]|nr:3-hydroxyisobutyryl-coenzyme A hydrolase isoform 1 [Mycena rebaudengoi]
MLAATTRLMSRTAVNRTRGIVKHMSSVASKPPLGADLEPVVGFESTLGLRTYVLNRPAKVNALTSEMLKLLRPKIEEWNNAKLCNVIAGTGNGRAFCAGGDVESVIRNAANSGTRQEALDFFQQEFDLDLRLAGLNKPYVAILDGLTMGGGVGLSAGAPFRVATENTVFSMPETKIGYTPDVGASYFMSRLDGELGTYLALTSATLKGRAVFDHGFATHFIPARRIPMLLERLSALETSDRDVVDRTLEEHCSEREQEDPPLTLVGATRAALDHAFKHDRVERIVTDLELFATNSDLAISQWASETLKMLHDRSPTSLKVALRAIRLGKKQDLVEALNMELKIATAFCSGASPDFATGVTSVLITKSKERPAWNPATLEEVTDEMVDRFFAIDSPFLENAPALKGSPSARIQRYGLPTEDDIRNVITGANPDSADTMYTLDDLLEFFDEARSGKIGVDEKVLEVARRKTVAVDNGGDGNFVWLQWKH